MSKIVGIFFALTSYYSLAAPGSFSGNIDDGGSGGGGDGWFLLLSFVGLPLALWIFSLICYQPAPADKKLTWWTSMDHVGKGVFIMVVIVLIVTLGQLFE